MANVSIQGLTKRFGGKSPTTAIDNLDLEIEPGEFLVLLGPSGCGKTTTLRCIAGLETANEGRIAFGDRTVFDCRAPRQRGAEQAQHRDGVPVVRALAAHDRAQERRLPAARQEDQGQAGEGVDRGGREARRDERAPRPLPRAAERRPAAARRALARPRRAPGPRALRRAAQQPRRAGSARSCARRSTSSTSASSSPPST